ncbi:hypothetical protein Tco_0382162 [Tanacetum coccineum]
MLASSSLFLASLCSSSKSACNLALRSLVICSSIMICSFLFKGFSGSTIFALPLSLACDGFGEEVISLGESVLEGSYMTIPLALGLVIAAAVTVVAAVVMTFCLALGLAALISIKVLARVNSSSSVVVVVGPVGYGSYYAFSVYSDPNLYYSKFRDMAYVAGSCGQQEPESLGEGIKARLDARSKNLMEELPHVLCAHRTMIKSINGGTPFSLTYETEAVISVEIGMPTLRTAEVDLVQNNEALEINLDLLEERIEKASIREAKSKAKMEKYFNSKV